MAQHLRVGSVVDIYSGGPSGAPAYDDALVTNITPAYLEFEWLDPATSTVRTIVRSWSNLGVVAVVTD